MNKHNTLVMLMLSAALSVPDVADASSDKAVERANNQINLWVGTLSQDYKEHNDGIWTGGPPILDTEKGNIRGGAIDGGAFVKGAYAFAHAGFYKGQTDYDGYISTTPPTAAMTTTDNRIVDTYFNGGYLWKVRNGAYLGPIGELGEMSWRRQIGIGTPYAVDELYNHWYAGVGLVLLYGITDNLSVKIEGVFGETFLATVNSPSFNFSNEKLGSKPITRGGFVLDYRLVGGVHVLAGIDSVRFSYGASDVNSSGNMEPRSDTSRVIYKAGLGYSFR